MIKEYRGKFFIEKTTGEWRNDILFLSNPAEYKYAQVIDGKIVQVFKDDEIEVLDLNFILKWKEHP